jgi:hypothetical protein
MGIVVIAAAAAQSRQRDVVGGTYVKGEGWMRSMLLLVPAILLGMTGCIAKFADQGCQDRGFSPGSYLYEACYPYVGTHFIRAYPAALQTALQPPYPPPP